MAPTWRAGGGWTFNSVAMALRGTMPPDGVSMVPTTTGGGIPPPTGAFWVKVVAGSMIRPWDLGPWRAVTPLDYEWLCGFDRIEGTIYPTGSEQGVFKAETGGGDVGLWQDGLSSSTFRYRLRIHPLGASAYGSTFSKDQTHRYIVQFDGTNAKLYIDDVLDITIACTLKPTRYYGLNNSPPYEQYTCAPFWVGSDTAGDIPTGKMLLSERLNPNGDNESADYGDQDSCGDGSGNYGDWILFGSVPLLTPYLCELGGEAGQETSTFGNLSVITTPKLVASRALGGGSIVSKTVETYHRMIQGGHTVELENVNLSYGVWRGYHATWWTAPDTGAWTEAKVNALAAGVSTRDTNGANDLWGAYCLEVFDLQDVPAVGALSFPLVNPANRLKPLVYGGLATGA